MASLSSREPCPFCGTDLYSRDIPRHVQERCKQATTECRGKNLMEECEKRRARRRGCQTLAQAFAKGKRARTDNGPAAGEDLLREAEDENLGQDGGVNLEVGVCILDPNANIGVEINNRDIQDNYNFGEVNANVKFLLLENGPLLIHADPLLKRLTAVYKNICVFIFSFSNYIFLLLGLWTSTFWERQTPADGTSTMMMPGDIMSLIILRQSEDLSLKSQN